MLALLTPANATLTLPGMFIRKTATRNKTTSEAYFTFRLVASERTGKQVRQITLLNLGRQFDLPRDDWPMLCARIDALLAGQAGMIPDPDSIETLAQRYAARLIAADPAPAAAAAASPAQSAAQAAQPALAAVPAAPDPIYADQRFVGASQAGETRGSRYRLAATHPPPLRRGYGIRTFDLALRAAPIANPAAMVANGPHPALIVLVPAVCSSSSNRQVLQ